jgi:CRISPR-associated protein Csx17
MTNEIVLSGCAPIPLAGYLKALGIFRLVAEQDDESVRGSWRNEQFVLTTQLTRDELVEFFSSKYQPTPILAPWNGGSGFYSGDNQTGIAPLRDSSSKRFEAIRQSINTMDDLILEFRLDSKPEKEQKARFIRAVRAIASEEALRWLDAAVLLSDTDPKYPPLLGTGGNDGRLDFTNNFMQRLMDVIDPDEGAAHAGERERLAGALFGDPVFGLVSSAIGQFSPGNAGGPNASTGFESSSLINSWDFILMLEGAVLFAASATRRLESMDEGQLSYPFTVRPTGGGSGNVSTTDEGNARAEIWMPLWERALSIAELRILLAEGRVTLNRRPARDGLDFARAVAKLGVSRGISAFQRYAFLMRSGKAYLATPLNRVPVKRNPDADLVDQLERNDFLSRFRRFARSGSARAQHLLRQIEGALFELAGGNPGAGQPRRIQTVLMTLGEVILYLADSPKAREECRRLPKLDRDWIQNADDKSDEFRVAAGFAGIGARTTLPMLAHLLSVDPKKPTVFDEQSSLVTWSGGALADNIAALLDCRLLITAKHEHSDELLTGMPKTSLGSISEFLTGSLDERRIIRLMTGMALVWNMPSWLPGTPDSSPLPAAYRVLKPLFVPNEQLRRIGALPEGLNLPFPRKIPRLLSTGKIDGAVEIALRRLRIAGISIPFQDFSCQSLDAKRLLAALMLPVSNSDLNRILKRIQKHPPDERDAQLTPAAQN